MNNKKGKVFYIVIGIVIIFLMNYFVFPILFGSQTKEVSYDFFLEELDRKNIDEVEVGDAFIVFTTKINNKDNIVAMREKNSAVWKQIYEDFYKIPLEYTTIKHEQQEEENK